MGIVNINDDSFSGDGTLDLEKALALAVSHLKAGADIIDAGAESARTNRGPISVNQEILRLVPFIKSFHHLIHSLPTPPVESGQLWPPLLSINTWRPEVVGAVLPEGVDLVNDISGLPDSRNAELCARHRCALLIMHTVGLPKIPHTHQHWNDVIGAIDSFFEEKIARAMAAGLPLESIILDPGIDFAKQRKDNLSIYRQLDRFQRFGRPILLPVSRKTVIGEVLGLIDPTDRDAGTVACVVRGTRLGAHIFRVHNVKASVHTLHTLQALI